MGRLRDQLEHYESLGGWNGPKMTALNRLLEMLVEEIEGKPRLLLTDGLGGKRNISLKENE
jgi:hypothetical protein